jgi:hypothetical protein
VKIDPGGTCRNSYHRFSMALRMSVDLLQYVAKRNGISRCGIGTKLFYQIMKNLIIYFAFTANGDHVSFEVSKLDFTTSIDKLNEIILTLDHWIAIHATRR